MKKKLLIFFGIIVLLASIYVYFKIEYKPVDVAMYLESNDKIDVVFNDGGILFDGEGEDGLFIFYPGAKVNYKAYSKLMHEIALEGLDCYIVNMPFNFALFNENAADKIITRYKYDNYYIGGHSLGGVASSNFASKNNIIKAVILLASYSIKPLNNMKTISIYGTEDGVLNLNKYMNNKDNWSDESYEFIIDGGNHANFGNYGSQRGDNEAKITNEEQQRQTIDFILKTLAYK